MSTQDLIDDLAAERAVVRDMIAHLDDDAGRTATPARGWSVVDQVWHLAYFDAATLAAATDGDLFEANYLRIYDDSPEEHTDRVRRIGSSFGLSTIGRMWDDSGSALDTSLAAVPRGVRIPWFGVKMSVSSIVTARIMETWAHGLDISDALGLAPSATDRLAHVAFLGCRARPFSLDLHGRTGLDTPVRVELDLPRGGKWVDGEADTPHVVRGTAFDFCAVITQRRHVEDTDLHVSRGPAADWISIGQAFAGVAGQNRPPGWVENRGAW